VKLLQYDDGMAADAYRKVVLEHSAAPHVEDAKERLAAMNLPIPTPTAEQVAASESLEGSRAQYNLKRRMELLVLHKPDTVTAARSGAPPLDDPDATTAPGVLKEIREQYVAALDPNAAKAHLPAPAAAGDSTAAPTAPTPAPTTGAPTLEDVPAAGAGNPDSSTTTMTESSPTTGSAAGASMGVEIVNPNSDSTPAPATVHATPPLGAPPSDLPAATGAQDPNYGLKSAAPKDATALPPIEKAADAPDTINDVAGHPQPPAQPAATGKKKTKAPAVDKNDESSSKKKKKKGVDKLNPF
jgi:outer membrane protein assembly factor BamD